MTSEPNRNSYMRDEICGKASHFAQSGIVNQRRLHFNQKFFVVVSCFKLMLRHAQMEFTKLLLYKLLDREILCKGKDQIT